LTCYFRHLGAVFEKAGIEVTNENKQEVDKVIHGIVGATYKNCPAAWKEAKRQLAKNEEDLATRLKQAWNNRT